MTERKPALPIPGATLSGRYVLGKPLGKGAMGIVYDGELIRLAQRVAIKVLRPEILTEPELVMRFDREARLIAKMNSEYVVRVLDVDTTDEGLPFLVMEKLDGRDLGSEIRARGPLPIPEAVEYMRQICAGVAEAHRAGIIHRDLKPSNIFLVRREGASETDPRQVKILDFGVSKMVGDTNLTATESTLGTPRYMSPEQIRSAKSVDERTDVWSMAVIMFELLSSKTPFAGESATGVAAAIVADQPLSLRELRPEVPEALERIVMAGLQKNPLQRIQNAVALREALEPFSAGQPPIAGAVALAPAAPTPPPFPDPHGAFPISIPPAPTQASWAHPEPPGLQPLPMRTLVPLFLFLFLGIAAALLTGLVLTQRPHRSSTVAAASTLATEGKASKIFPTTSAPSSPEAEHAQAAPPDVPSSTPSEPPSVASAKVSASASRPDSPPVSATSAPAIPAPAIPASATPAPAMTGAPRASTSPVTAPPAAKLGPPKDCPVSQKILVGSKLVCP